MLKRHIRSTHLTGWIYGVGGGGGFVGEGGGGRGGPPNIIKRGQCQVRARKMHHSLIPTG